MGMLSFTLYYYFSHEETEKLTQFHTVGKRRNQEFNQTLTLDTLCLISKQNITQIQISLSCFSDLCRTREISALSEFHRAQGLFTQGNRCLLFFYTFHQKGYRSHLFKIIKIYSKSTFPTCQQKNVVELFYLIYK